MKHGLSLFSRSVVVFLIFSSTAFSGDEGVWNTLTEVHSFDDKLRLVLIADEQLTFKGCDRLVVDIEEYDAFKWDIVALITDSVRPEKEQSLDELLLGLNRLKGGLVYIAERTPLKSISSCHYLSDGAVLNGGYLFLFFKLYHL